MKPDVIRARYQWVASELNRDAYALQKQPGRRLDIFTPCPKAQVFTAAMQAAEPPNIFEVVQRAICQPCACHPHFHEVEIEALYYKSTHAVHLIDA